MDEIDAALDFRNVSIVGNYIKERTRNAQFIIISLRNNMFELRPAGRHLQDEQRDQVRRHRPRRVHHPERSHAVERWERRRRWVESRGRAERTAGFQKGHRPPWALERGRRPVFLRGHRGGAPRTGRKGECRVRLTRACRWLPVLGGLPPLRAAVDQGQRGRRRAFHLVVGSTAEQRGPEQQSSQGGVWTSMARAPPATARRVPRGSHINIHNTSPRVLCVGALMGDTVRCGYGAPPAADGRETRESERARVLDEARGDRTPCATDCFRL